MGSGILILCVAVMIAVIGYLRRDLLRGMAFMAICALPIAVLLSLSWQESLLGGTYRAILIAFFAALSSVLYSLCFRLVYREERHPDRYQLIWLLIGLVVFACVYWLLGWSLVASLGLAVLINSGICLIIRADLIWSYLFTSLTMATFYAMVCIGSKAIGVTILDNAWFSDILTGITLWGSPIEDLIMAGLLGGYFGTFFNALKGGIARSSHVKKKDRPTYGSTWINIGTTGGVAKDASDTVTD